MPATRADVDALFAPVYSAFPLAADAIHLARAEVRRLYPPVPAITRLYVADAGNGQWIATLTDGALITASTVPAKATIVAEVSAACSLLFEFDGQSVRQESNPPYSIGGDSAGGRLSPWNGLTVGRHVLRVTPFDKPGGRQGAPVEASFAIVADTVATPPTPPPEPGLPPLVVDPPAGGGFSSLPPAPGARQIYVRANGDDGNPGDAPDRPLRTVARAVSLLRRATGDRMLLHAGDRFEDAACAWRFSGFPQRPAGIFAYGDGARPILATRNSNGIDIDVTGVHDVAFVGLHLTAADRDPADTAFRGDSRSMYGIQAVYPTRSVLIEDCRIDHFMYNISFVAAGNKGQHADLLIRRCLLLDAWGSPAELFRGQGIYLERCRGVGLIECVLDHNGWIEGAPGIRSTRNIYRHGAYISDLNVSDVRLEANLASRSANYGAQLRCGGDVRHNVFFDNATCVGVGGEVAEVSDNLFVGGHDTDQYGQGTAIEVFSRRAGLLRNVMLDHDGRSHKYPASRIHVSRRPWTPIGDRVITIIGNALWGCDGAALRCDDALAELTLHDNDIQQARQQIVALDKPCATFAASGNAYTAGRIAFTHHLKKDAALTLAEWCALTGDNSVARQAAVVDADWRLGEAFVRKARSRPRGAWDAGYDCREIVKAAQNAFRRRPS